MTVQLTLLAPTNGKVVGQSVAVSARVTVTNQQGQHAPSDQLDAVTAIIAGGPPVAADRAGGVWSAQLDVPVGPPAGTHLVVTVTAAYTRTTWVQDPPGEWTSKDTELTRSTSVQVVVGATALRVSFDAFDPEVAVAAPPYVATLTGTVGGAIWGIATLTGTVDGAPVAVRDLSGDKTRWGLDVSLAAGAHLLRVAVDDPLGNTGSAEQPVLVRLLVEPTPVEQAFAATSYLKELLALAGRRLRLAGSPTGPAVAALEAALHQPFGRLVDPASFEAASAPVRQPRVTIEVLRAVLRPADTTALDQRFRGRAYEALVRELGSTSEELRLARTADPPARQKLADRLGLGALDSRPDRLDALTVSPDLVTDEQLETLLGYRSTQPADPLRPGQTAQLLLWRLDALRRQWADADARERDAADAPLPVLDPDVIGAEHLRPEAGGARSLWRQRAEALASLDAEVTGRLTGPGRTSAGFDQALAASGLTVDVVALAARDAAGEDVSVEAALAGLTLDALRHLARIRQLVDADLLTEAEWADVAAILVQVGKRALFPSWRLAEQSAGVVLEPATFVADPEATPAPRDPAVELWRGSRATYAEWRRVLRARGRQADAVVTGYAAALDAVEARVLPALRDALLGALGERADPPRPAAEVAERLSRDLAIDLQSGAAAPTTRVTQAIDTVQALLVAARTGRLASGDDDLQAGIADEAAFDAEWEWLETYQRWRSGLESFAYPETRLLPELFRPESIGGGQRLAPTAAYLAFLDELADRSTLDPALADTAAQRYLAALKGSPDNIAVDVELRAGRSDAEIDAHRLACQGLVGAATREQDVPQHVREIFWLVPVTLARRLQQSGEHRAALDWLQTVFAFHRGGAARFVYHGLALEQRTTSTYARVPDWAEFARQLNPHFTGRLRKGAYTRFTVLSIVEAFLAFADDEFARGAADGNARALALYQNAADLLGLAEVAPETGPQVPYPANPMWSALRDQAASGLAKVHAGLNVTGESDPTVVEGSLLPSPYRYAVLVERAKGLVASAQQVEAAYLAALERADAETYARSQANQDLRTAQSAVLTQDLRVAAAADGMQQATLQQERAQTQYDTYDQWIREGRNDAENNALDAMRAAELAHVGSGVAHLVASWKVWTVANNLASALSETAAALSTEAQIQQTKASFERRKQEWELSRNLAAKDADLAAAQVDNATLQHTIALQDKGVAVQHADYAATVAEFLATKFTNADLYRWMSGVLGRAYAYLLQQATAVARLAQAQLAFERQEPLTAIVAGDYWRVGGGTAGGQQLDRGGMTGSVRLLADLVRLDQHAFETDRRKLHLSQTFALSELAADELQRFRDTGRLTVATTQELFDRSFPGHYLRLVKKVKVTVVALVPALRGLRATLSASGVSRAVVARGPFDTVTLRRDPESIAFTSPLGATGLFDLEPEGAMLLPFEGMGIDAVWQLELPKAANPFDYRGIADVLLTVDYTALDSPSYRQTVIRSLDRSFSADRTFSLRNDVPDAWFQLSNPDGADPAGPLRARLPLTRDDFPPNVDRLAVAHLSLFVLRAERLTDELSLDSVTHTVAGQPVVAAAVRTVGGIVSTRRAGGAPLSVFIGADPAGDWELAIDGSAATRSWFAGGLIQDVVLVLSLSGTLPAWG